MATRAASAACLLHLGRGEGGGMHLEATGMRQRHCLRCPLQSPPRSKQALTVARFGKIGHFLRPFACVCFVVDLGMLVLPLAFPGQGQLHSENST